MVIANELGFDATRIMARRGPSGGVCWVLLGTGCRI